MPEGSVGRSFSNVDVSIRDLEDKCIDTGSNGRIFVQSNMMFVVMLRVLESLH